MTIEAQYFRETLSCYPTGVSVVTSVDAAGEKLGMVVGSFTSISLAPALVGFFVDEGSSTWPRIEGAGRFCVNVLAAHQTDLCGRFAARGTDRFAGLDHGATPSGLPLLDDVAAWIDCVIDRTEKIGDHWLAVGRVLALAGNADHAPLLFHRKTFRELGGHR